MSSYINITQTAEIPIDDYIGHNWVFSQETDCFGKHVSARVGYLLLTPWAAITSIADTFIGIGAGIATIATLGKHGKTFQFAVNHLSSSETIVARPYANLLRTLNPQARFSKSPEAFISCEGDGFITHYVIKEFKAIAREFYNSNNCLVAHFVSRLTYVLLAIACVITRIVDGIIGIIAVTLSFLTLGMVESINNLAFRGLKTPSIIYDLFYCTVKIINPWAGTSKA